MRTLGSRRSLTCICEGQILNPLRKSRRPYPAQNKVAYVTSCRLKHCLKRQPDTGSSTTGIQLAIQYMLRESKVFATIPTHNIEPLFCKGKVVHVYLLLNGIDDEGEACEVFECVTEGALSSRQRRCAHASVDTRGHHRRYFLGAQKSSTKYDA